MSIRVNFLKNNINDNIFNVCSFLLKSLHIKYSNVHLNRLLTDHLHSSSLLAVQDTLSEYGIKSVAIRKGEHSYNEFEFPFICSIQQMNWPIAAFTVVTNINNGRIDYFNPLTKQITTTSIGKFQSIGGSIIMLIDGSKAFNEINLRQNLVKEQNENLLAKMPIIFAFTCLFSYGGYILTHYTPHQSWMHLSYLLTTFLGTLISMLLIWHEFDKDNSLIKQVCGKGGKKVNCNAVLSSSHSSMLGISWSIWGETYFSMLFLIQLLFVNSLSSLVLTASISLLVLPYIFYSISLQWLIIKQWCLLCLGIQALLTINAVIALSVFIQSNYDYKSYLFQGYPFFVTMVIGIFMFLLISTLVSKLRLVRDSNSFERNLRIFKSDKNVFKYFLKQGERLKYPVDNLGIIIGNPIAHNEIIKVCNPYCSYCSDMQIKLERLIKKNNDIRLRLIFTVPIEKNDIGRKAVAHFLAIQKKYGNELAHTALYEWYSSSKKDFGTFARRFVVDSPIDEQDNQITDMNKWVDTMQIRITPTLFFNGYEFPSAYNIEDLSLILKK